MKRITSILTATILMIAMLSGTAFAATSYSDLASSHWAYQAVTQMSADGIIKGYANGKFSPIGTVTYGEFIKMAFIAKTNEDPGNFTGGNWATNYYNKSIKYGFFTADEISLTDLDKKIPRTYMAVILDGILKAKSLTAAEKESLAGAISDVGNTTPYADEIFTSYANGLLTGYTDKTFKPNGTLSRAEAATVLYRFLNEDIRVYPGKAGTEPVVEPAGKPVVTNPGTSYERSRTEYEVTMGDLGLSKIIVQDNGWAKVYFTKFHGATNLYIDNLSVPGLHNADYLDGHFTETIDGTEYFMYIFQLAKFEHDYIGKHPSIWYEDEPKNIYTYTDFTF